MLQEKEEKQKNDCSDVICIDHLTKDYGNNRGVFDISFNVKKGEVYGFLGPNGAGKTTTIRHLLGFSKPQSGNTSILGLDSWKSPKQIQEHLGYLPGEIALPDNMTGWQFIKEIADMRNIKDLKPVEDLCKYFSLDPRGELKRMSKGMKQKIGIVIAFMHDPEIIILDEPTSGLDPLMQAKFCELIKKEKAKGKTILMSSHMFDEVEKTCDKVAIIKQGKIVAEVNMKDIEHKKDKEFEIRFESQEDFEKFLNENFNFSERNKSKLRVKIIVNDDDINDFFKTMTKFKVKYISEIKYTLEKYFMQYYKEAKND